MNWPNLRKSRAPFIPQLTSITDTKYFPTEDLNSVPDAIPMDDTETMHSKDLAFVGYTFKRWETVRGEL